MSKKNAMSQSNDWTVGTWWKHNIMDNKTNDTYISINLLVKPMYIHFGLLGHRQAR